MLLLSGIWVTTSLFINQGQVKLRNIHQPVLGKLVSYILFLTLNSVVTEATGKNICGSHILLRVQCGKVKVIDQSNDLPVFLVYFSYESLEREIIIRLQLQIKRLTNRFSIHQVSLYTGDKFSQAKNSVFKEHCLLLLLFSFA